MDENVVQEFELGPEIPGVVHEDCGSLIVVLLTGEIYCDHCDLRIEVPSYYDE